MGAATELSLPVSAVSAFTHGRHFSHPERRGAAGHCPLPRQNAGLLLRRALREQSPGEVADTSSPLCGSTRVEPEHVWGHAKGPCPQPGGIGPAEGLRSTAGTTDILDSHGLLS